MATWPSGTKASATTTDADSDSISGARGDINQSITNQNAIIDTFNIGTPGAGDDDKVLTYDHSTGFIVLEASAGGGGNPLTADLEVADFDIINSGGSHRGDTFTIGGATTVETSTSSVMTVPSQFDAGGNSGQRLAGPVELCIIDDLNTWNNRVHSLAKLTSVKLTGDFTSNSSSRIRNNYVELSVDTAGNDFGPTADRFGDGAIGQFITSKVFNSGGTSSTARSLTAMLAAPQNDGNTSAQTVTQMRGMFVQPFLDANATATNLYGFIYKDDNINGSATVTNHYSFFSDSTTATLQNDGPAQLSGLSYPTSDGGADQFIKTNGSGTLSFGLPNSKPSFGSPNDIGTISATASTFDIDYSNGPLQKVNLTAATGLASTVLNEPTNMADGDVLYLTVGCTAGTVGQNGEFTFKTGVNYITSIATVSAVQGSDEQFFMFLKSGTNFLVTQLGGTMSPR